MYCNKCGNFVDVNVKFCNKCGNKFGQTCSRCYNVLPTDAKFCNKCGNSLINVVAFQHPIVNQQNNLVKKTLSKVLNIVIVIVSVFIILLVFLAINTKNIYYAKPTIGTTNNKEYKYANGKTTIDISNYIDEYAPNEISYISAVKEVSNYEKEKCLKTSTLSYEEEIMKRFKLYSANLCELSDDYLRKIIEIYDYAERNYPGIFDYAYATQILYDEESEYAISNGISKSIAVYGILDNVIGKDGYNYRIGMYLNTTYFLNEAYFSQIIKRSSNSKHFPANATIYSPIIHELGHKLHYDLVFMKYGMDNISIVSNDNYNKSKNVIGDLQNSITTNSIVVTAIKKVYSVSNVGDISKYTKDISAYAATNSAEAIAESVHDYYLNAENAHKLSKEIVEVLKEEREKYFR